jgi:hypothetical protein
MLIILAPLLILLAPFIYFVKFFQVPMMHVEFIYLVATIIGISLVSSLLLWRAGWIRLIIVQTFLITFALSFLPSFQNTLWLKVAFFVILGLSIWLGKKALPVFTYMAGIFCLALLIFPVGKQFNETTISQKNIKQAIDGSQTGLSPPQTREESKSKLPPIIHIIFDEHIGVDAIPTDTPQGKQLQDLIKTFYPHYGFRLYSNAYSRYSRTYDSIPNLLNFTLEQQDSYYFPGGFSEQILTQNKDFELLSSMGYKIHVVQPVYIDFCHANQVNYESCYSYPVYSLKYFYQLDFPWQQRYGYLLKSYLFSSSIFQGTAYTYMFGLRPVAQAIGISLPRWGWDQNQMSTIMTLTALQDLKQDVLHHADDGTAFFAHILLPHSPYIYDQNCQIHSQPMDWLINYDFGPQGNTPERRALRYQLYETQTFCLYKQLQNIFDAWQQAGIMNNAIIIVNGDHSSRLPVVAPTIESQGKSSKQDFDDAYPALFAVKAPGYQAGIDDSQATITYLFGRVMEQVTGQSLVIDDNAPYVFLTNDVPGLRGMQVKEAISSFK